MGLVGCEGAVEGADVWWKTAMKRACIDGLERGSQFR